MSDLPERIYTHANFAGRFFHSHSGCEKQVQQYIRADLIDEQVKQLQESIKELEANAAFYRSCALSGTIPNDGDEPHPEQDTGFDRTASHSADELVEQPKGSET